MLASIKGGLSEDHRGSIRFVNDFEMTQVKRFYIISNKDTDVVRGWRGHRIEQRWFFVSAGAFCLDLVKIDEWESSSTELPVDRMLLRGDDITVVHVPAGYATAFQALEPQSELIVFADYPISHATLDDHTWPSDYFVNRLNIEPVPSRST